MHKWVVSVGIVWLLCCYNVVAQDEYITLEPSEQQHFVFSEEKDMHPCSCDMIKDVCDYHCCCDSKCDDNDKEQWKKNGLCVDKQYSHISDLKCKDDTFDYNTNEVGMNFFDQVKQLLCVKWDNTGSMGEYYQNKLEGKDIDNELYTKWKNKVWKGSEEQKGERLRQLENNNNDTTPTFYSTKAPLWNEPQNYYGIDLTPDNFQFNVNTDVEIKDDAPADGLKMFKYGENSNVSGNDTIITLNDTIDKSHNWYLLILTAKFGLKTNPQSYIFHAELLEGEKVDSSRAPAKLKIRFKDVTEYDD